ncbi:MAG: hypothetical protein R6U86_08505 [Bacteroidales bacterium]
MRYLFLFLLILFSERTLAQVPTHIPTDSKPVDFFDSTGNIVFFIVLPILIAGLYLLWRHRLKRGRENNQKNH